jgi:hypothetical protein
VLEKGAAGRPGTDGGRRSRRCGGAGGVQRHGDNVSPVRHSPGTRSAPSPSVSPILGTYSPPANTSCGGSRRLHPIVSLSSGEALHDRTACSCARRRTRPHTPAPRSPGDGHVTVKVSVAPELPELRRTSTGPRRDRRRTVQPHGHACGTRRGGRPRSNSARLTLSADSPVQSRAP